MTSAGEVKAPKTYKIGPYTFIDEDGDGKLSRTDSVEVNLPEDEGGRTQRISASAFLDVVHNPKLLGTDYATLEKQSKKFLPSLFTIAYLMVSPKNDDELVKRLNVEKVDPPVASTAAMFDSTTGEPFSVPLVFEYTIPREDIGARRYLSSQGYRFRESAGDPDTLIAIKDPEEAVRHAKPYAPDGDIREYLRQMRFVR